MDIPLFLIPIVVGLLTQFSKRFFNRKWIATTKLQGLPIPRYGGMPSSHTAFAFSLLTLVGMVDGIYTTTFAMTAAATIFILDDALRMRMFLGKHGQAIYTLITTLPKEERKQFEPVERRLGHTPAEVSVGAIVGVVVTLLFLLVIR